MSRPPDQLPPQDAQPAKVAKATSSDLHELRCHLQRSVRYHKARERFFESWSNWFSFASLLAGSGVVISILSELPDWISLAAGGSVAAMQAIEQVFRLSSKARDHSGFASEFSALEKAVSLNDEMTKDDLREIRTEILSVEAREPPVKRYLDLICHNQVACAIGSDDVEHLKWWQRWFAQYLNGDGALQG